MVPPEPLGNILERISDGFVAFDAGMNYTYVNQKGGEILGRKPEDLVGKNYWEEYPEAKGTSFANAYVRALEAQEPIVLEEYYPPFRRWFENRIYPSSDGLAIFFTDVTERRQARAALDRNEQVLQLFVKHSPAAIAMFDREMNYIIASDRYRADYDLGEQPLAGRSHYEVFPEIPEHWRDIHKRCLSGAVERMEEDPFPRQDGRTDWVRWEIRPWHEAEGEIGGIILFSEVITERRRMMTSEREQRLIAETLREANVALTQTLTLETILTTLLEYLSRLVPYDSANVMLVEGGSVVRVHALRGYKMWPDVRQSPAIQTIITSRTSLLIPDTRNYPGWLRPAGAEHVLSWIGIPLISGGQVIGLFSIDKAEPDFFTEEHRQLAEGLAGQAAVAIQNARLFKDSQSRLTKLNVINESSRRLQKLLSPDQLAHEILTIVEDMLDYTYGAILLVDDTGEFLEPFAISDQKRGTEFREADREFVRSKELRLGRGITGWVAQHGESVRLDDVRQDARYLAVREDVRAELCVPLENQDRVIGVLNVESNQIGAYTQDDQRLLETIAAQIAVAIQNSRLFDHLRRSRDRLSDLSKKLVETHETESRAIGRELHDQIGQMLTALKLTLEVAPQLPAELAVKRYAYAQELVDDLLTRISRLTLDLRPPMLDDLGLVPALAWHVTRLQEQSGIDLAFNHRGVEGRRFDFEIETTAYRVIQESLTNAMRHARASRIRLEIRCEAEWMHIHVEDDGTGFDPAPALAKNRGLGGMRERIQLAGGEFHIESRVGEGAKVSIRLPLKGRDS
jgi:PAS domain S-box-containing protein